MRHCGQGSAWGAWAKGLIIGSLLAVALPAVASSPPVTLPMAEAAGAESLARHANTRGLPEKPAGLDDAGWASLQQAIRKSAQQAKLVADDGGVVALFGESVALSGDTALVGSPNRESAYVYTRSGATWTQQAQLVAADGAGGDEFGWSVALAGNTALVGAYRDAVGANLQQGSANVYTRSGATWTQQAQLVAADGAGNDKFGYSVALAGDTARVGAFEDDVGANGNQGSAYVFARSGTSWTQQAQLVASDGAANDDFGYSVALSGDSALVGATLDDVGSNTNQGSAYAFARSGDTWTQQAQLVADDGAANDWFGRSVDLSGDTALSGSERNDVGTNEDQGSAYVFFGLVDRFFSDGFESAP